MLKIQEIRELIKLIDQSSIDEFTYEVNNAKIKLKKNSGIKVAHQERIIEPIVTEKAPSLPTEESVERKRTEPTEVSKNKENERNIEKDPHLIEITSPMVGTFYQSSSPEADPYVEIGSKVGETTVVCIVEAMKLFNEIEAEIKGEIVEVLVTDGQLVEYGQALFLVKAE